MLVEFSKEIGLFVGKIYRIRDCFKTFVDKDWIEKVNTQVRVNLVDNSSVNDELKDDTKYDT